MKYRFPSCVVLQGHSIPTLLLIAGLVSSLCSNGQDLRVHDKWNDTTINKFSAAINRYDTTERGYLARDRAGKRYLSKKAFNKLFEKYFTLVTYNRESVAQGNSSTFSVADDETYFSLALAKYWKMNFLSAAMKVNLVDKDGSFFSKDKPTHGNQFSLTHTFLLKRVPFSGGKQLVHYNPAAMPRNYSRRETLLDSLGLSTELFENDFKLFHHRRDSLRTRIAELTAALPAKPTYQESAKVLEVKMALQQIESDSIKFYYYGGDYAQQVTTAFSDKATDRELAGDGFLGVSFTWISYGMAYEKDQYNTFDSLANATAQFGTKDFNQWSGNISINWLFQSFKPTFDQTPSVKKRSLYAGLTYSITGSNSYASLDTKDVQTIDRTIDPSHVVTTSSSIRDISNLSWKQFPIHKLSGQVTWMFSNTIPIGVNLIGSFERKSDYRDTGSARVGILYKFIQTDDAKSTVNLELFTNFSDLSDSKMTGKGAFERKTVGITASVPFEKLFF